MAVKVGSLWKNPKFQSLDDNAKLLYIYLATNPSISTLGVVLLNISIVGLELNKTLSELQQAAVLLIDSGFVFIHKSNEGVYFVVLDHFMTLPKSETLVGKAKLEIKSLPKPLSDRLSTVDLSKKFITFTEPTEQEVLDYATTKGYIIDAKHFINFYRSYGEKLGKVGWYDSKGKIVKNWQGKLTSVWFPKAEKLKECKDAPKGYEFFYVENNGTMIFPDYWRDNKPYHKGGLITTKKLQDEYARKAGS